MNAIRLEINIGTRKSPNWQVAFLEDGESIELSVSSQLFGDRETFSEEFSLPFDANRHILGNTEHVYGRSIYEALYDKEFRLWIEGVLFMRGTIDLDEEVELDGSSVDISLIAGRKLFDDMLDGVNAQDVEIFYPYKLDEGENGYGRKTFEEFEAEHPGFHNIPIGYTWNGKDVPMNMSVGMNLYTGPYFQAGKIYMRLGMISLHRFGFNMANQMMHCIPGYEDKYPSLANASARYEPGKNRYKHPFVNIPLCAMKYAREEGSSVEEDKWEKKRGYVYQYFTEGDVDLTQWRYNSSPCFYVLFWLEQLFDYYMKVGYNIDALCDIDDLRGLCFINTKAEFGTGKHSITVCNKNGEHYRVPLNDKFPVGKYFGGETVTNVASGEWNYGPVYNFKKASFYDGSDTRNVFGDPGSEGYKHGITIKRPLVGNDGIPTSQNVRLFMYCGADDAYKLSYEGISKEEFTFETRACYATSRNFPDVDAKTVIEGIEHAFGMKFIYSERDNRVTPYFYRDVLSSVEYDVLDVVVSDRYKVENHTRGFRLKYSNSSEFKTNALTKDQKMVSGSDDTTYNYNDYTRIVPLQGSISDQHTNGNDYAAMVVNSQEHSLDFNYYISAKTGNGYRYKVDSDAETMVTLYPSLFEVGGYRDVNYGDCTNEEYVEEVSIPFSPVNVNDVNFENQAKCGNDKVATDNAPCNFALFVDPSCGVHPSVKQNQIPIPIPSAEWIKEHVVYNVREGISAFNIKYGEYFPVPSKDSFTFEQGYTPNDDKVDWSEYVKYQTNFFLPQGVDDNDEHMNPMNSIDMGFTLGIVRQGNSHSDIVEYDKNYDGEGNSKYYRSAVTGNGFVTSDSCDSFGNMFDTDQLDAISLKLKAEKPVRDYRMLPDERPFRRVDYDTPSGRAEYDATEDTNRKIFNGGYYVLDYEKGNALYYDIAPQCANRGLYDKFWADYAYFITHRKVVVYEIPRGGISLSALINIDMMKRYKLFDTIGWIKSYKCTIDKNGLGDVTIEMYYF